MTRTKERSRADRFSPYGRVWRITWPIILSNLSIPLVGAVDTAVVGHLPDARYIGAVALGAVIFSFLFWGFGFLRMGTTGFVAQSHGRRDGAEVAAITLRGLLLACALGILVVLLQGPIGFVAFWALEGSSDLEALADAYFGIRVWSAPATLANYVILGVLIGLQRTRIALGLQLLLNGTNVALDLIFVIGFDLHVEGVAYASVCSDWAAALAGISVLYKLLKHPIRELDRQRLYDAKRLGALLHVNANIMLRTLCLLAAFFYFTVVGTRLGEATLAANAVLMHLQHFLAYGLDGFAHAAEALAGSAYGARRIDEFRAVVRATSVSAIVVAFVYTLVYTLLGEHIIDLITNIEAVRDLAKAYLPWLAVSPVLSVWSFQLDGIFIGTTRTNELRNGMILSLGAFLASVTFLVPTWGNHGLWLALLIFMIARALCLLIWYPRILRGLRGQVLQ